MLVKCRDNCAWTASRQKCHLKRFQQKRKTANIFGVLDFTSVMLQPQVVQMFLHWKTQNADPRYFYIYNFYCWIKDVSVLKVLGEIMAHMIDHA